MTIILPYGVGLTVECALSAATGLYSAWDTGLWDTAAWGPDQVWTDISEWVRSVSTDRKFNRDMSTWESGEATIELRNFDARFSPANLSGPYVTAGVTGIRPWRPVRIRVTWAGVTYDLYRGYVRAWKERYDQPSPNGGGAYMVMSCVDEYASLARFGGLAQAPVGAGELSGIRIHRILDNAGHAGARNIDVGNVTMQATTLAQTTTADLKITVDSEGGALFIDRSGAVVFERKFALVENARSNTIQATYGDHLDELPYSVIEPSYDGDLVVNIAAFTRAGGTTQTVTDETSRALYEDKRFVPPQDFICETDAQVLSLAQFYLIRFAEPEDRIESIDIRPRFNPALLFPQVLSREVRDLVRVVRRPPGGITVTRDCHIARIAHQIAADHSWTTTFGLWSASAYAGVGRWELATWDVSRWFF